MALTPSFPLEDIIRSIHFATLGASALLVIAADLTASRSTIRSLQPGDFQRLHRYHNALTWGLLAFWISGAYLIWAGTAFQLSEFSPKLIAKILVVSILTLNAWMIGRVLLPFMEGNKGQKFGDFPLSARLRLAFCGAISSASWISAFCLGSFAFLKTASAAELISFLGPIYIGIGGAATLFALVSGTPAQTQTDTGPIRSARRARHA